MRYVFGKRGQRRVHGWRLFYRLRVEVLLHPASTPFEGLQRGPVARLWVDREAFPRIQKLLARARHTIIIQMFIWKDDTLGRKMALILLRAADRGVKVYITKEAVGDVFEFHRDFLTTREGHDVLWQRFWHHKNIRINYAAFNDHAKVYIIDEKILLLTGMNIADEYHEKWHDYLVELRGSQFASHYLSRGELSAGDGNVRLVMNAESSKGIRPAVMSLLSTARQSIVLEQCYLSDTDVLDLLIRRSHEGIRIVVILPVKTDIHHYVNMQSVTRLLTEGKRERMEVFLYPRIVHGKIILVDRERAFVGSANMMKSSIDDMGEVNVLITGKHHIAIQKLRDVLKEDILQSRPLTTPPRLSWIAKWMTWLKL